VKEPTEHLTMAKLLAVLRERLPEWPPIKNDESKIRAALQVLTPEPEWRHDCREDIRLRWEAIDRVHGAVGDAEDRRRERDRLLQMGRFATEVGLEVARFR